MSLIRHRFLQWTAAAGLAVAGIGFSSTASAGVNWSVGVALPGVVVGVSEPAPVYYAPPAPVYYAPPPVYYRPAPGYYAPPRGYYRPAPGYYAPPPRGYYRPAPAYYGEPPPGYGRGHGRHHRDWR